MVKAFICATAILLLTCQTATSRNVSDRNDTGRALAFAPADPDFWAGKKKLKKHHRASRKALRALKAKSRSEYRKRLKARQRAALRQEALDDAEDAREDARIAARAALRRGAERAKKAKEEEIRTVSVGPIVQVLTPAPEPRVWSIFDVFREFLERTPVRGYTMTRQGFDVAFGYLNPIFRERLARTIWEAQGEGYQNVGVYSAYRKPSLGVGGFGNKSLSCHAYGLAVDVVGIGRPGSREARRFHEIALKNKVYGVYGPNHRVEFNHLQAVPQKVCGAIASLRKTITRDGPKNVDSMWSEGEKLIRHANVRVARNDNTRTSKRRS